MFLVHASIFSLAFRRQKGGWFDLSKKEVPLCERAACCLAGIRVGKIRILGEIGCVLQNRPNACLLKS